MYVNKDTTDLVVKHIRSFVKTYITAFLAIALFAFDQGVDVFATAFIIDASKVSLISALRNVYKFLTEDVN